MSNQGIVTIEFHKESTSASNGGVLYVQSEMNTANIEIAGTSTLFECVFEGKSINGGLWHQIMGVDLANLNLSTSVSAINKLFQVDLIGLIEFRVRVNSISNGNVSVNGRVVN